MINIKSKLEGFVEFLVEIDLESIDVGEIFLDDSNSIDDRLHDVDGAVAREDRRHSG